ncbi:MAG: hypothetical protein Q8R25_02680 [bacterium]|nr:hypothetical protein [bacterium]
MARKSSRAAANPVLTTVEEVVEEKNKNLDLYELLSSNPEEILELLSKLGPEAIPMIKKLYDELMDEYRPILKMAPALAGMVSKDVAPLVAAIFSALNELVEADDMKAAMAKMRKIKAMSRWDSFTAYTTAGFDGEQAFTLVLQDAASVHSAFGAALRQASVSRKE